MRRDFIKLTNTFICFNLERKTVEAVNREDHEGLRNIHLFVFDPDRVRADALRKFGVECRKRKVCLIMHCPSKEVRFQIRKMLKGVPKGRYFHTSLMRGREMYFRESYGLSVVVLPSAIIEATWNDGSMAWDVPGRPDREMSG